MAARTFDRDLWDGTKVVYERYEEGQRTLGDFAKLLTARADAELSFSKDLQKLASQKYSAVAEKYTVGDAWTSLKNSHEQLARQHAELSNQIKREVIAVLEQLKKDQARSKDALEKRIGQLDKALKDAKDKLKKAKEKYHTLSKQAEQALMQYEKAQQDSTVKSDKLTKLNASQQQLKKDAEAADAAYIAQIKEFNAFQSKFEQSMKEILAEFQVMDEKRLEVLKELMVEKYLLFQQAYQSSLEQNRVAVSKNLEQINVAADVDAFLAEKCTGEKPPPPVEYEPFVPQFGTQTSYAVLPSTKTEAASPVAGKNAEAMRATTTKKKEVKTGPPKARALYDYSAAEDNELGFVEGDVITVTTVVNDDWWIGESKGRTGMFPQSYVEIFEGALASLERPVTGRQAKVAFDFTGRDKDELTCTEGEIITIKSKAEEWYVATKADGTEGMLPCAYVQLVD